MATTNTEYSWYWYVRKVGRRYRLGLVNDEGDDPSAAYTIQIFYDQFPNEIEDDDTTFPIPAEYEMGLIKKCASEILKQMTSPDYNKVALFEREYEDVVNRAVNRQIRESQEPMVTKPLDLRDDAVYGDSTD